ncbi:hypothetical protein RFW18_06610 [Metabacillus idriensis]|uniref:hypothetical protein n=1 Tax=Metabacillus idriensis TaxID=324768 RepID=UPI002813854A|nr:hypothetical protein [Metabacillus idriensis]MDR0137416.1 hypothetical protein [Metabacillus idriensis]
MSQAVDFQHFGQQQISLCTQIMNRFTAVSLKLIPSEKRKRPFNAGMTDKDPAEEALFVNTYGAVLPRSLSDSARH